MLKKQSRLNKNKDFAQVFQRGERLYGRYFTLRWLRNNLSYSRFGIIVSLKVDKKAVIRNKIKRRIRAIFKDNLDKLVINCDFLISTRKEIKDLFFQELKEEIQISFQKRRLIKTHNG